MALNCASMKKVFMDLLLNNILRGNKDVAEQAPDKPPCADPDDPYPRCQPQPVHRLVENLFNPFTSTASDFGMLFVPPWFYIDPLGSCLDFFYTPYVTILATVEIFMLTTAIA